jgi:hypothetical protein
MHSQQKRREFPRLLLGAALIFWGWMVNLPLAGLLLGFVLEGHHWIRLQWNFTAQAHARAWSMSVVFMLITGVMFWMGGVQPETVLKFVSWMPMFLFPLQFTQSYGKSSTMLLSTFSYFSRRKNAVDRSLGLVVKEAEISFTAVYFVLLLLCCAAGVKATSTLFFEGLIVLTTWAIWSMREKRRRPQAIIAAIAVVMVVAVVGQLALRSVHEFFLGLGSRNYGYSGDDRWSRSRTHIGQIGKIKQSTEIAWRLKCEQGKAPVLLKMASYNRYFPSGNWSYDTPGGVSMQDDTTGLTVIGLAERRGTGQEERSVDEPLYRSTGDLAAGQEAREDLPRFVLRGSVRDKSGLPLPGRLHTIFASAQDMEKNSIGSVRITPRHAVLDGVVRWGGDIDTDAQPFRADSDGLLADLAVPNTESAVLRDIVDELGIRERDVPSQCRILQNYFARNFRYTKDLGIDRFMKSMQSRGKVGLKPGATPLAQFLTEVKAGHCEYFATAATLLLRESGVKARYCVGFAVQEFHMGKKEYVIRGTHGHAWCRAWDEAAGAWIDVDCTPGAWIAADSVKQDWRRAVADFFLRLREDFTIWRIQKENQTMVLVVLLAIAAVIVGWIVWRLWKTRSREARANRSASRVGEPTPLTDLEPWLEKYLGKRQLGHTLARWLMDAGASVPPELLAEVAMFHQRWRYDRRPLTDEARRHVEDLCREIKARVKNRPPLRAVASSRRES